jgi:hypothetical protein
MAGKGIARPRLAGRAPSQVDQRDVAPTIAVLLGTTFPAQNEGQPLFQSLVLPAQQRAAEGVDVAVQRRASALAYARALGVDPPSTDAVGNATNALQGRYFAQAAGDADGAVVEIDHWLNDARADVMERDWQARAPAFVAVALLTLAFVVLVRPRRETLQAVPFGVLYGAAFWLLYLERGYTLSLGTFNTEAAMAPFLLGRVVDAVLLTLAVAVAIGVAFHRAGSLAAVHVFSRAVCWIVAILGWQVAVFFVLYGATYRLYLPDMALGLKYYLDLLQLAGVGLSGIPAAGVTAGAAALARRLWLRPAREPSREG